MAYIRYADASDIPSEFDVPDEDHILRIHGVHPAVMKAHFDLYRALMYGRGPLSRVQREMIALAISSTNECVY